MEDYTPREMICKIYIVGKLRTLLCYCISTKFRGKMFIFWLRIVRVTSYFFTSKINWIQIYKMRNIIFNKRKKLLKFSKGLRRHIFYISNSSLFVLPNEVLQKKPTQWKKFISYVIYISNAIVKFITTKISLSFNINKRELLISKPIK